MDAIAVYELASWLGDTNTMFHLIDKDSPELDEYLFKEDLSWHYTHGERLFPYDVGEHVEDILGQRVRFFKDL